VNGSSWVRKAAVAGFWSGGSDLTQAVMPSAWCGAVAGCVKNSILKPRVNMSGAPPAGST
jgi:hypothetical protein